MTMHSYEYRRVWIMAYSKEMEYIEACHVELLYPHRDNRRRIRDQRSINPTHPAIWLTDTMELFNNWCDTAHTYGYEDNIVDRDKADKYTVLYCVTGYRNIGDSEVLTEYPAIVHTLYTQYVRGYVGE